MCLILRDGDASLFQSLVGKLEAYPALKVTLRDVLMEGKSIARNPDQSEISQS